MTQQGRYSGGGMVKVSSLSVGDYIRDPRKTDRIMIIEEVGSDKVFARGLAKEDTGKHRFISKNDSIIKVTNILTESSVSDLVVYGNGVPDMLSGMTFYLDCERELINAGYSAGISTATFTATRSTALPATYIDSNGVVQLVTVSNTPRFVGGYYDATGFHSAKGLVIEAAGTNLVTCGAFDTNCAWDGASPNVLSYSGIARWQVNYTDTGASTNTISTDSKYLKSAKISITNAGTTSVDDIFLFNSDALTITNATVYTLSFWVKTNMAKTIPVSCVKAGGLVFYGLESTFDTVANTWIRVTKTFTANTNANDAYIGIYLGQIGTFDFYIESLQLEANPYATSFIPTTTAALTRNAETVKYENAGNRTAATESIAIKFMPLGGSFANDGVVRNLIDTDTKRVLIQKGTASTTLKFYPNATDSGTSVTETTTSFLVNTSYVLTIVAYGATAGTNSAVAVNGTGEATNTTNYTAPAWGDYFYMGSSNTPDKQLNGLIQKVAIFNRALSATEISKVTGILNQ